MLLTLLVPSSTFLSSLSIPSGTTTTTPTFSHGQDIATSTSPSLRTITSGTATDTGSLSHGGGTDSRCGCYVRYGYTVFLLLPSAYLDNTYAFEHHTLGLHLHLPHIDAVQTTSSTTHNPLRGPQT
ncbi:hypothetical protein K438DRAFT_2019772 [Mycena galopus ATCC 62051]|nr:hypothetical protein K438DRAFT_2019772 [Mycena galopus ATCC 62051]